MGGGLLGRRLEAFGFLSIYTSVVFWRWYSRISDNAPSLFIAYAQILRQTTFPTHTIILANIAVESFNVFLGFLVLLFLCVLFKGNISITIFIVPLIFIVQISIIFFLTTTLAICGVYFKDLAGIVFAINGIWFYLSPGIYPVDLIPEQYLSIYYINPFAHILPAYHDVILNGKIPDFKGLFVVFIICSSLSFISLKLLLIARRNFFNFM